MHDTTGAELSRRHNDANALCLGARFTTIEDAKKIVAVWLETPFEGGRHEQRVRKIGAIEARNDAGC